MDGKLGVLTCIATAYTNNMLKTRWRPSCNRFWLDNPDYYAQFNGVYIQAKSLI